MILFGRLLLVMNGLQSILKIHGETIHGIRSKIHGETIHGIRSMMMMTIHGTALIEDAAISDIRH